jgi:hypothetical protein
MRNALRRGIDLQVFFTEMKERICNGLWVAMEFTQHFIIFYQRLISNNPKSIAIPYLRVFGDILGMNRYQQMFVEVNSNMMIY